MTRISSQACIACLLLIAAAAWSCGGSSSGARPVPSMATSLEAQSSFQPIRERWLLSTTEERAALEHRIEAFRMRFGSDPLARVADAYLAFIALDRDDTDRAQELARRVRAGPRGTTRDLGTLIEGAGLSHAGKPEEALRLLDPLVGKLIDPFAQDLLHETAVGAAVDAHRWYEAVIYMNEWLRGTNERDMPRIRTKVDELLVQLPPESLENALRSMGATQQRDLWERELREALAARLASVAMERSDPKLARSVLETSRTVVGMGDAGTSLAQLATSGGRAPRIVGARVGLLVETGERAREGRSAQVVAGALEVFKPAQGSELAPDAPRGQQPPVLITRDVSPAGSLAESLEDLVYRGAAVIIGGYDPERSAELAAYAETQSIPVVLLVAPESMPKGARFTFLLGAPAPSWTSPVPGQAASQVDPARAVRVSLGDPPDQPRLASCSQVAPHAGETAFPVTSWRQQGVDSVAVDGPAWCARKVLLDLTTARFTPTVFLGLEARTATNGYEGGLRIASCGYLDAKGKEQPSTLQAWRSTHGEGPSWFEALGRDAARLAHSAVAPLPRHVVTDLGNVVKARAAVQQTMLQAEAVLWTTQARGFGGTHVLARKIRYVHEP